MRDPLLMKYFFILFLFSGSYLYSQSYEAIFTAKVIGVIDGNTIEVIDANDETYTFMLSEVDCPEMGQELSAEAKAFTSDLILKKKVIIERAGKDWLGNKLAVIKYKNGRVLHEEILKKGMGWASKKSSNQSASLQSGAKDQSIGIWSVDEPTPPWIFRRQQTMSQSKSR